MLKIVGYLFYVAAVADLVLYNFMEIDLTGVSWSPIVGFLIGSALIKTAARQEA